MGDGGAMFLGFMMATLGLKLHLTQTPQVIACVIPVLVLAVPFFDTTLVTISRSRRGLIPFASPGKDHAAHRLANFGFGQRGAVLVLYGVGTFAGLLALAVTRFPVGRPYALAAVMGFVLGGALIVFERLPYERQRTSEKLCQV